MKSENFELEQPTLAAKDFLGNDINVGDALIYMVLGYRELKHSFIMKITRKCVFLHGGKRLDNTKLVRQEHHQVVKI